MFRDRVEPPARKASAFALACALFAVAHLARLGTPAARIGGAAVLVGLSLALGIRWWIQRRGWSDARRVVLRTVVPTDRDLGQRTLRAMALYDRAARDPSVGSSELAQAHLERTIARVRPEAVGHHAERVAHAFGVAA